ncbi:hypothetical protein CROQUDRAFT_377654 [Cronartium quercuum f. sp. fusiforme G11]|uniref:Retrotransposon gag domain-containing protein n=1 Tax=Cronartium quercuum f. sp. fusiforme G11 TaxID=708437 RepID=A0A9P6NNI2_9BASI|nr:hypothetical protein CROQUDRAFT_377654 [Cronartium quercuum f. sp. fusiforme G11]
MSQLSKEQVNAILEALGPHIAMTVESQVRSQMEKFGEEVGPQLDGSLTTFRSEIDARLTEFSSSIPNLVEKVLSTTENPLSHYRTVQQLQVFIEPRVLSDVSFSGGHTHLRSFIHVIKEVLLANPHAYGSEAAKIRWVARHIRPIGCTAHNWWMGLIKENAVAQGVKDTYDCSGIPFVLVPLQSVDTFLKVMIREFRDKVASSTALRNLQVCRMGSSTISDYNSRFNSLALDVEASDEILIDYYKKGLTDAVRRQSFLRVDWAPAKTLRKFYVKDLGTETMREVLGKQDIAVLAANQLDKVDGNSTTRLSSQSYLQPQQSVSIAPDPDPIQTVASLKAKLDFLRTHQSHPSCVPHPPADPPTPALLA